MSAEPGHAPQPVVVDGSSTAARTGLIGTALVDSQGAWEVVDERLCELLSRPEAELLSRSASQVFVPEDEPRERERLNQLLSGSLPSYRSEARLVQADGSSICALLEAVAVDDGEAVRCLFQLQDVTARKNLEAAGTGWALAAEDLDEGAVLVAVKGLDGLHVRINSHFARAFAVSDERLRGRGDEYLFPATVAAALREGDREAVAAAPEAVERVDAIPRASGDEPMCFARFALRGATAQPYAVCTLAVEPSEREALGVQLERLLAREHAAQEEAREMRERLLAEEESDRSDSAQAREQVLAGMSSSTVATLPDAVPAVEPKVDRASEDEAGAVAGAQTAESLQALEDERAARAQAEAERDRVREEMDGLAEELVTARQSISHRELELQAMRTSLRKFEQAIQTEQEAQTQAEAERERVREEVDARAEELERQRQATAALEAELSQTHERLSGLEEELAVERERVREEIGTRDGELERERAAQASAQAEVSQMRARLTDLESELAAEREARAQVEGVREKLEAERYQSQDGERAARAEAEAEVKRVREEIGDP